MNFRGNTFKHSDAYSFFGAVIRSLYNKHSKPRVVAGHVEGPSDFLLMLRIMLCLSMDNCVQRRRRQHNAQCVRRYYFK
jgi:hypothetical protein